MTTLTVNRTNTLRLLADSFSGSTTFVKELLQNARRAGATKIEVIANGESLVIKDNGCGITDFATMLSLGASGWSEDTMQSDAPYGVGFLSAIMASVHFSVTSIGRRLEATSEGLINGESAKITDVPTGEWATVIDLVLKKPITADTVRRELYGFPVDTTVNGTRADRPFATDLAAEEDTFVVPGLGTVVVPKSIRTTCPSVEYFLQGLPIGIPGGYNPRHNYSPTRDIAVHLDPTLFKGRMPDREVVIDNGTNVSVLANAEVTKLVRLYAERAMERCNNKPDLSTYKFIAHFADLVERVDALPGHAFDVVNADECLLSRLQLDGENESYMGPPSIHKVTKQMVEEGEVTIFSLEVDYDDPDYLTALKVLAEQANEEHALLLDSSLRYPLWVKNATLGICEVQVIRDHAFVYDVYVDGFGGMSIYAPDDGVVEARLVDEDDTELMRAYVGGVGLVDGYYYTDSHKYCGFFQLTYDLTDDGSYAWNDTQIEACERYCVAALRVASTGDTAAFLRSLLANSNTKPLAGTSFTVSFDAMGLVESVTLANPL